jgi:hypothetical protein
MEAMEMGYSIRMWKIKSTEKITSEILKSNGERRNIMNTPRRKRDKCASLGL